MNDVSLLEVRHFNSNGQNINDISAVAGCCFRNREVRKLKEEKNIYTLDTLESHGLNIIF